MKKLHCSPQRVTREVCISTRRCLCRCVCVGQEELTLDGIQAGFRRLKRSSVDKRGRECQKRDTAYLFRGAPGSFVPVWFLSGGYSSLPNHHCLWILSGENYRERWFKMKIFVTFLLRGRWPDNGNLGRRLYQNQHLENFGQGAFGQRIIHRSSTLTSA